MEVYNIAGLLKEWPGVFVLCTELRTMHRELTSYHIVGLTSLVHL